VRIIAGPCQHESLEQSLDIAYECKWVCDQYLFDYYFKASYDKANRTHVNGKRGLGLHETIRDFLYMKDEIPELKIVTDVHEIDHIQYLKDIVDVIQIPAFLCRQTDLIQEACKTNCIINIKKGQFLAPWDVAGILSKTEGAKEVWITERGTSFGYNRLVVDYTGLQYLLATYDIPIVFDGTHAVQSPGGQGNSSGGNRAYVRGLCRAAAALGVNSHFLEVHPDPDNAPSDGPNMLRLEDFQQVIDDIDRYTYSGTI
jgi:2-dehydro-3-deoxyphosphooctonate aldolase (KDO 8-P synthase)